MRGQGGKAWGGASYIMRFTSEEQQNPQETALEQYNGTFLLRSGHGAVVSMLVLQYKGRWFDPPVFQKRL